MELDLRNLFWAPVYSCTHWLRPRKPQSRPRIWAYIRERYWSTKDGRHLFVTLSLQVMHSEKKHWEREREGDPTTGCVGAKFDDSKKNLVRFQNIPSICWAMYGVPHEKKNWVAGFWISPQEIKIVEMNFTEHNLKKIVNKFQKPEYCRICFLELRTFLVHLKKVFKHFIRVAEPDPDIGCWIRIGIRITLIKKKLKFSSYIRKLRVEQLQSQIWGRAS